MRLDSNSCSFSLSAGHGGNINQPELWTHHISNTELKNTCFQRNITGPLIYSSVQDVGQLSRTTTATQSKLQEEDPTESAIRARYKTDDQIIAPAPWCSSPDNPLLWTELEALLDNQFVPIYCGPWGGGEHLLFVPLMSQPLHPWCNTSQLASEGKRLFSCSNHVYYHYWKVPK